MKPFIQKITDRYKKSGNLIQNEEQTKTSLIKPFFDTVLGFDTSDPFEFQAEYQASFKDLKDKVDYAAFVNGKPAIIIECKPLQDQLGSRREEQLARYFTNKVEARIAILTNGIIYKFYSDLLEKNVMDNDPFFTFNLLEFTDEDLAKLERFSKNNFDIQSIINSEKAKFETKKLFQILVKNLSEVNEDLVKKVLYDLGFSRSSKQLIEEYQLKISEIYLSAITEVQSELISKQQLAAASEKELKESGIETTDIEKDAFLIFKTIFMQEGITADRISNKDFKQFFNIILDGKQSNVLVKLYLNNPKNLFFQLGKEEGKYSINSIDDILNYSKEIKRFIKSL